MSVESTGMGPHLHGYCPTAKRRVQVAYYGGDLPTCPGCGQGDMEDLSIHPPHSGGGSGIRVGTPETDPFSPSSWTERHLAEAVSSS